jgi:hypothetical protein
MKGLIAFAVTGLVCLIVLAIVFFSLRRRAVSRAEHQDNWPSEAGLY